MEADAFERGALLFACQHLAVTTDDGDQFFVLFEYAKRRPKTPADSPGGRVNTETNPGPVSTFAYPSRWTIPSWSL